MRRHPNHQRPFGRRLPIANSWYSHATGISPLGKRLKRQRGGSPAPLGCHARTAKKTRSHSNCGVNPNVKTPESVPSGAGNLLSGKWSVDRSTTEGACVHSLRQTLIKAGVLANRSVAKSHNDALAFQAQVIKHKAPMQERMINIFPWTRPTSTSAFSNPSPASSAPCSPTMVATMASSRNARITPKGSVTRTANIAEGAFCPSNALLLLLTKQNITIQVYHGAKTATRGPLEVIPARRFRPNLRGAITHLAPTQPAQCTPSPRGCPPTRRSCEEPAPVEKGVGFHRPNRLPSHPVQAAIQH